MKKQKGQKTFPTKEKFTSELRSRYISSNRFLLIFFIIAVGILAFFIVPFDKINIFEKDNKLDANIFKYILLGINLFIILICLVRFLVSLTKKGEVSFYWIKASVYFLFTASV